MKKGMSFIIVLLVCLSFSRVQASMLYDYNSGSGTSWTEWTWSLNASGFGEAGWTKNSGRLVNGSWYPRSHAKDDYGNAPLALIDTAKTAPSTANGGSLKVYDTNSIHDASWWWIYDTTFGTQGVADGASNRFSMYFWAQGFADPGLTGSDPENYNVHLGTYLCWPGGGLSGEACPKEANGQHYYHWLVVNNGAWIHVLWDRHPQHQRGVTPAPTDNPAGSSHPYFQSMNIFYLEYAGGTAPPTTYWVDELNFYTETQPENDISIASLNVGYWPSNDWWEIGFMDASFGGYDNSSVSTFEIRYSNQPITNANFSSAMPITPLYNAFGGAGRIRRPNSWKQVTWTRFKLPSAFLAANTHVYFAVKDVSSTSSGDGHQAPSPYIKTIDYYRSPTTPSGNLPNAPANLSIQ